MIRTISRLFAVSAVLATSLFTASMALASMQALPPNVYFHFTDGHHNDFRVPQAVPGLTSCDQAKLAVIAKAIQKQQPVYAGWTYVKAECKAR